VTERLYQVAVYDLQTGRKLWWWRPLGLAECDALENAAYGHWRAAESLARSCPTFRGAMVNLSHASKWDVDGVRFVRDLIGAARARGERA